MKIISIYAPKGGSGRTVSTMALASAFLALSKRVFVIDCTDLAGSNTSPLLSWFESTQNKSLHSTQLELAECQNLQELEDTVASARARGFERLLIDTSARIYEPQLAALYLADLIIAPSLGPLESERIVDGIDEHIETPERVIGLVNGCQNGRPQATRTRYAFGNQAVFKSELPWSEALSDQMLNGDIATFVVSLACRFDEPGFARFRNAQAAWVSVQRLAFEVDWILEGQRLESVGCHRLQLQPKKVAHV